MNPDNNVAAGRRTEAMPTLKTLDLAYGEGAATSWLVPRLLRLSEFAGCREKLSQEQLRWTADMIAAEWSYLDLGEIDDFLKRFMTGRYGHFYGAVDPLVVMEAIRRYMGERAIEVDREQRERERKARDEACKDAITWEQFCAEKGIDQGLSPIEQLLHGTQD